MTPEDLVDAVLPPFRVRRMRTKGWRMPDNTVYVGRPTIFGNPYRFRTYMGLARVPAIDGSPWEWENRISGPDTRHDCHHPDGTITIHNIRYMTRAETVETFRTALLTPKPWLRLWHRGRGPVTVDDVRRELAGKNLACWCPLTEPCHADVLLEVANEATIL